MGKFTKTLIAMLLCVAMIGGMLPMTVHAESAETEYTLYPTPHSIAYGEGSFELTDINAIYGEGIDEYTVARLEETAALKELSVEASGETDVYVAIYGSGDEVEQYILDNYTVDTSLFTKTDANFVAINDGEIVVLGAMHSHESAMGVHMSSILNHPSIFIPIPLLRVVPVHWT